jgi:chromosome segregation ATPase
MAFDPITTLREWKQRVGRLQERWRGARREIEQLRKENEQLQRREKQLEQREKQLEQEREQLRQENEKLKRQLEEAQRANKRQHPFLAARVNRIRKHRGASPVRSMVSGTAKPFHKKSTKSSPYHLPRSVSVVVPWK